jgi:Protein of unknown function (DUF2612)
MPEPIGALPQTYYSNLLTSEYRNTVQFNQWLNVVLGIATDISNCLLFLNSNFDLDYAVGAQLDILGTIVGVSRTLPFQPSFGVSPVMTDSIYRLLLYAAIANNQWNGTIGGINAMWATYFQPLYGSMILQDQQNMTALVELPATMPSIILDLVIGYAANGSTSGAITGGYILPRPQGVEYNWTLSTNLPGFGFSTSNTSIIAGFDLGKWIS